MPRPGAANGVVPKNGIGIAFWIAGRPRQRRHRERRSVPSAMVAGINRRGMSRRSKQRLRHRAEHERRQRTG